MYFLNLSVSIQLGLVTVCTGFLLLVSNMFGGSQRAQAGQYVGEAPVGGGNQGVGTAMGRNWRESFRNGANLGEMVGEMVGLLGWFWSIVGCFF